MQFPKSNDIFVCVRETNMRATCATEPPLLHWVSWLGWKVCRLSNVHCAHCTVPVHPLIDFRYRTHNFCFHNLHGAISSSRWWAKRSAQKVSDIPFQREQSEFVGELVVLRNQRYTHKFPKMKIHSGCHPYESIFGILFAIRTEFASWERAML